MPIKKQYEDGGMYNSIDHEPDMEQKTASKLGKKYIKAVHCHPAYLTHMQTTSCKLWS